MKDLFGEYGKAILMTFVAVALIVLVVPMGNLIGEYMKNTINTAANNVKDKDSGEKITYTINYVSSTGVTLGKSELSYKEGSTHEVSAPVKVGYTTPTSQTVEWGSEVTTLTFEYEPIEYTITYNMNGGTNSAKNPTSYTVESDTVVLTEPTKTDYNFDGFYSDAKFENRITKISKGTTKNIVLYAKWSEVKEEADIDAMSDLQRQEYVDGLMKKSQINVDYMPTAFFNTKGQATSFLVKNNNDKSIAFIIYNEDMEEVYTSSEIKSGENCTYVKLNTSISIAVNQYPYYIGFYYVSQGAPSTISPLTIIVE